MNRPWNKWIVIVAAVLAPTLLSQTSENNPRLKKALERHPAADVNKDGVLTLKEARAYQKKHLGANKNDQAGQAGVPKGGVRHIYKTAGDVDLPLYVFAPAGHSSDAKTPAIVFFFGGGWKSGSPTQFEHHCEYLAKRGMVAVTVEYRVSSRHAVKVEDCIEDAKSAMRWMRANAAKLGVDPDRIASAGGSAGGHLAACTAVIADFDAASDPQGVSAKPDAMVLFNPALGFTEQQLQESKKQQRTRGPVTACLPLTYATAAQAPCIMFFGTEDGLLQGAEQFREQSEKAGNSCEIVSYEGERHGFFNYGRADGKYYELTVAAMDAFLVELGWLSKN